MARIVLAIVVGLAAQLPLSVLGAASSQGAAKPFDASHLPLVKAGETTLQQVHTWFGTPWKVIQFADEGPAGDIIWEYRGRDAQGAYRVHIEFDKQTRGAKVVKRFAG